ncbi:YaaC family protein [Heyndrickxia sporothermodurans]
MHFNHAWEQLNYYHSAEKAQKYLYSCYKDLNKDKAELKSYENCYPFIYFLQHGEIYYNQAEKSPFAIKPVLLFYGLIHLIKACLLTVDPNYPETTSVLAHGVSSRKKKKQHYQFVNDEIKIQKMGLCTHFSSKMFHVEQLDGEKIVMKDLFLQIPELDDYYLFQYTKNIVHIKRNRNTFFIPKEILDKYHFTIDSFIRFLKQRNCLNILHSEFNDEHIILTCTEDSLPSLPFRFHLNKNCYCLPTKQSKYMYYPELMIHYLLLYNLSMVARYETEWWGEVLKTTPTNDYPLIKAFLSSTEKKSPILVWQYLNNKS